jgi:hypothetical protein
VERVDFDVAVRFPDGGECIVRRADSVHDLTPVDQVGALSLYPLSLPTLSTSACPLSLLGSACPLSLLVPAHSLYR